MARPGVEPGLQSSQDCVLSTERPDHQKTTLTISHQNSTKKICKILQNHYNDKKPFYF